MGAEGEDNGNRMDADLLHKGSTMAAGSEQKQNVSIMGHSG